jgi:hypothetical protein
MTHHPGEGTVRCLGRGGVPCSNMEIEGLEYCLHHVPDEMLDEAEGITGFRRCRHDFGQPSACHQYAVAETNPLACIIHGAQAGSVHSKRASAKVVELRVARTETDKLVEHWDQVISAPPVTDALGELRRVAGQIVAWKDLMLSVVRTLDKSHWRYTKDKMGEQVRAEIILAGHALDRAERCLLNLAKLDMSGMQLALDERMVSLIELAFTKAIQASDASLEGQDTAMQTLRRELKLVA